MLIDLAFLIPTLSLFHSFVQYGNSFPLNCFVLIGSGLIIKLMMILVNSFLAKENLDKNTGSLVVNDLQFYEKD